MTVKLNRPAYEQARKLVRDGDVVRDERDDWSEDAASTDAENRFLDSEGWTEFSHWHLGIDTEASEETKGRFEFPFGDYKKVHRCAVISMESRAAQYGHDDIAAAAKKLLELIDSEG
jgi:hypothetical protein